MLETRLKDTLVVLCCALILGLAHTGQTQAQALRPSIEELQSKWVQIRMGGLMMELEKGGEESLGSRPGQTVVYLARVSPQGKYPVFLDDSPLGFLTGRSYISTVVEPGMHLLWGTPGTTAEWLDLRAGRSYLLVLVEQVADNLASARWVMDDPEEVKLLTSQLRRVEPTEEDLARLRKKATPQRIEKAGRRAGDSVRVELPADFSGVFYRPKLKRFNPFQVGFGKGGRLVVDQEMIRYQSSKHTLEIPVTHVQKVCFAGFKQADSKPWIYVLYGEGKVAHFSSFANYNPIFAALMEAVQSRN